MGLPPQSFDPLLDSVPVNHWGQAGKIYRQSKPQRELFVFQNMRGSRSGIWLSKGDQFNGGRIATLSEAGLCEIALQIPTLS